ncbi:TetR/AcrR family transcriptional regulator [soil metagenome]
MPRPLTFDPDTVLDQVVQLFWEQGYRATSVQDLVTATGLNRSSLYHHFGGKDDLFAAALQHYVTHYSAERLAVLQQQGSVTEALRAYFDDLVDFSSGVGKGLGCLLTNTAAEVAPHDARTRATLADRFAEIRTVFENLLNRGQAEGEVTADKDTKALANFFLGTVQGVRVLARTGADVAILRDIVSTALSVLE